MRSEAEFDYTAMAVQINFEFILVTAIAWAVFGMGSAGSYGLVLAWGSWFLVRLFRRLGIRPIWSRRR